MITKEEIKPMLTRAFNRAVLGYTGFHLIGLEFSAKIAKDFGGLLGLKAPVAAIAAGILEPVHDTYKSLREKLPRNEGEQDFYEIAQPMLTKIYGNVKDFVPQIFEKAKRYASEATSQPTLSLAPA